MRILTVTSYDDFSTYEVTLQASNIAMVTSQTKLVQKQGIALRKVHVKFMQPGEGAELYINGEDLKILQEAVGFYYDDDLNDGLS